MSRYSGTVSPIDEPPARVSQDHDRNIDAHNELERIQSLKESPLITADKDTEKASQSPDKSRTSDWYVWEALAVGLSAAILIALVVILTVYNEQREPRWRYMSLNSLISWLSTVSKGLILFSLNETLGQMKWIWFKQKSRPMADMQEFDTASRGPYGALLLIWRLRARHFATLGCLAVILALGFDPFTQNLIHHQQKMVIDPTQSVQVGNATTYSRSGSRSSNDLGVDPALKSNVYESFFNRDRQKPWAIPQYFCSSGNCTWDAIASLEARAMCANVTEHLEKSCRKTTENVDGEVTVCNISLPNSNISAHLMEVEEEMAGFYGFIAGGVKPEEALVYTNATMTPIQFITPRMVNISDIVNMEDDDLMLLDNIDMWEATECVIEPFVRSARPKVHDNVFTDETLGIWNDAIFIEGNHSFLPERRFYPPWGVDMGMQPNTPHIMSWVAQDAIDKFIYSILSGYLWFAGPLGGYNDTHNHIGYASKDILQALGEGDIVGCGMESSTRLSCSMHNIAAAISKTFRDSAYLDAGSDYRKADMAAGHAFSSTTCIVVHWQWIALPVLVWVLGAIMLVGSIWKTHLTRVPKWRNDPLPLLFLYEGRSEEGQWNENTPHSEVKELSVKLYESNRHMVLGHAP